MVDTRVCVNPHRYSGCAGTEIRVAGIDTRRAGTNTEVSRIHFCVRVGGTRVHARAARTLSRRLGEEQRFRGDKPAGQYEAGKDDNRHGLEICKGGLQAFHGAIALPRVFYG